MKRITRLILLLSSFSLFGIVVWYSVTFYPYLYRLKEIAQNTNEQLGKAADPLYDFSHKRDTDFGIRTYAIRMAYQSLSLRDNQESNFSWHSNNLLWLLASYIHFNNQEIFGIWVDCALYQCGEGLWKVANVYYGKELYDLSDRELLGIVVMIRNPKTYYPGNEKYENAVKQLLKQSKESK